MVGGAPAGVGRTRVAADRFVATKRQRWEAFNHWAQRAESDGITIIPPADIPDFAARYREAAADLARARTYGVDPGTVAYLERAVAAGHNAIYRGRSRGRPPKLDWLRSLPRTVMRHRRYVLTALLLFLGPAIAGFAAVRNDPDLARRVLPSTVVARAAAGASRIEEGQGYVEVPSPHMPVLATRLISNNIQVALVAFAAGVTAGLGTVVILAFNGLFFGAVVGLFANYDITEYLLAFVVGHGVWELTAIFLAGAGGLIIGRAIWAPGDLLRRDAIVLAGRTALELLAAAAILLLGAGLIAAAEKNSG